MLLRAISPTRDHPYQQSHASAAAGPFNPLGLNEILTHNDRSVFAFTITTGGMREYAFYAREWTPEQFDEAVQAIDAEGHELQFMMKHDPHWNSYKVNLPHGKF